MCVPPGISSCSSSAPVSAESDERAEEAAQVEAGQILGCELTRCICILNSWLCLCAQAIADGFLAFFVMLFSRSNWDALSINSGARSATLTVLAMDTRAHFACAEKDKPNLDLFMAGPTYKSKTYQDVAEFLLVRFCFAPSDLGSSDLG